MDTLTKKISFALIDWMNMTQAIILSCPKDERGNYLFDEWFYAQVKIGSFYVSGRVDLVEVTDSLEKEEFVYVFSEIYEVALTQDEDDSDQDLEETEEIYYG